MSASRGRVTPLTGDGGFAPNPLAVAGASWRSVDCLRGSAPPRLHARHAGLWAERPSSPPGLIQTELALARAKLVPIIVLAGSLHQAVMLGQRAQRYRDLHYSLTIRAIGHGPLVH